LGTAKEVRFSQPFLDLLIAAGIAPQRIARAFDSRMRGQPIRMDYHAHFPALISKASSIKVGMFAAVSVRLREARNVAELDGPGRHGSDPQH
jgi:hypothetical protein